MDEHKREKKDKRNKQIIHVCSSQMTHTTLFSYTQVKIFGQGPVCVGAEFLSYNFMAVKATDLKPSITIL